MTEIYIPEYIIISPYGGRFPASILLNLQHIAEHRTDPYKDNARSSKRALIHAAAVIAA